MTGCLEHAKERDLAIAARGEAAGFAHTVAGGGGKRGGGLGGVLMDEGKEARQQEVESEAADKQEGAAAAAGVKARRGSDALILNQLPPQAPLVRIPCLGVRLTGSRLVTQWREKVFISLPRLLHTPLIDRISNWKRSVRPQARYASHGTRPFSQPTCRCSTMRSLFQKPLLPR
jgi:hypothetical protein